MTENEQDDDEQDFADLDEALRESGKSKTLEEIKQEYDVR